MNCNQDNERKHSDLRPYKAHVTFDLLIIKINRIHLPVITM
jgi:hypothetical protein